MRLVIQRVKYASVKVNDQVVGSIQMGLLVFMGVENNDDDTDILWLSKKICQLRIFNDDAGIMNKSLHDVGGDVLLISQFTLFASTKKGNRPSYSGAAIGDIAVLKYQKMISQLQHDLQKPIQKGVFGADMKVELLNDGPVTLLIDSKNKE